ncbi:hypothetical protein HOLleu_11943 [Holothuria leucospilota]|uniref:Uncharacterized protein n=1 Tax=Holothuria leucospilota TaxID=206669 RepID=A0A9Q1CA51_HOLLE|nr:hypothetical protein HOLleu_11943 [Holothuria leucospilota]
MSSVVYIKDYQGSSMVNVIFQISTGVDCFTEDYTIHNARFWFPDLLSHIGQKEGSSVTFVTFLQTNPNNFKVMYIICRWAEHQ